ncbi:MAG TPA: hydroxyacylglutathione hydrolase [Gammaproteobacteria bacterium]
MLDITPIPAFADNYIWMIRNADSSHVAFVDPGEAHRVIQRVEAEQLIPVAILITHHHGDHIGGVRQLLERFPDIKVYGPANESITAISHKLKEGDRVELPELNARFQVLDVPGHTRGHIAYYGHDALFCGDTLFACGCGRLFEGTAEQMERSLSKIAALPPNTLVYCAHEYTLDNIGFAKWVEPNNEDLMLRDEMDMARQEKGVPTVPSTLDQELKTNPFLRYKVPEVKQAVENHVGRTLKTDAEVFGAIREWKDSEYD